jgi:hypothetical protein
LFFRLLEKYQAEILSLLLTGKTSPNISLSSSVSKISPLSLFPFEEKKKKHPAALNQISSHYNPQTEARGGRG